MSVQFLGSPEKDIEISGYITPGQLSSSGARVGIKWSGSGAWGTDVVESWFWIAFGEV